MILYEYIASKFGIIHQFNLSNLFIDVFAYVELLWDRKRTVCALGMNRVKRDCNYTNGILESQTTTLALRGGYMKKS